MCGILLIAEASDPRGILSPEETCEDTTGSAEAARGAGSGSCAIALPGAAPLPLAFAPSLACRGPDAAAAVRIATSPDASLLLAASLLQLRGAAVTPPLVAAPSGGVLCFNGEVFGGLPVPPGDNDGACLLEALEAAGPESVPRVLGALRGPWALVYWRARERRLWFGRDWLGAWGAGRGGWQ
jgi:asparagine synthetase B (glutamine-hydrolysing)